MDFLQRIERKMQGMRLSCTQINGNTTAKIKVLHLTTILKLISECKKELSDSEEKFTKLLNQYRLVVEKEAKEAKGRNK